MLEYLKKELAEERRRATAGGEPSYFSDRTSSSLSGLVSEIDASLKQAEADLVKAMGADEGVTKAAGAHATAFALLRDVKTRYASPLWLRRRGILGKKASRIQETAIGLILEEGGPGA